MSARVVCKVPLFSMSVSMGTHNEMGPQSHGLVGSGLSPKQEFLPLHLHQPKLFDENCRPWPTLLSKGTNCQGERGSYIWGGSFMWDDTEYLLMTQTPQALQRTDIHQDSLM